MTNEDLLREISSLPAEARALIEKYIDSLKKHKPVSVKKRGSFRDEPAFGIWKDREEMKDSVEWVRNIRKTHWRQRTS